MIRVFARDDIMQSDRRKGSRWGAQKNLPTLKSSTLVPKTLISVSRVDIDSRAIQRERAMRSTNAIEPQHHRSKSGLMQRKHAENAQQRSHPRLQPDPIVTTVKTRQDIPTQSQNHPCLIEKAKVSTKSHGVIEGYSANSHPGPVLSFNEDRICIVTNLTKTPNKAQQVSFFGIYDGRDGVAKADYLRDCFHLRLASDENFPQNMHQALRSALSRTTSAFRNQQRFRVDDSKVCFTVVVVANQIVYCMQSGTCGTVFSQNLGKLIFSPQTNEKGRKSVSELGRRMSKRESTSSSEVEITQHEGPPLDFILLGSQGVFETMSVTEIGKKTWVNFLKNRYDNIHLAVGEVNNALLSQAFSQMATKNASIILVAFEPVVDCLEVHASNQLKLPFLPPP